MKIRVGIALRNFSGKSGVGRLVAELCRRLPARDIEPVVFAHRLPAVPLDALRVGYVPYITLTSWLRAATFDAVARRRLRGAKPDLVHGHGDLCAQDVLSVHNCDAAAARYVPDGRKASPGVEYVRRRQFGPGGARVIVANSDMVKRDLAEFYGLDPARIARVHPAVDLEAFRPGRREAAREKLLAEAGWPASARIALAVISGDPAKRNLALFFRALDRLAEKESLFGLVVGDESVRRNADAARLERRGVLRIEGATPRVEDYFASADVFVLPAHYEEFGMPVLEALASGCPVAVSRRCGAVELVRPEAGTVFDDLVEPDELCDSILRCLTLKRAAARSSVEGCTWDRHADETAAIYRRLIW